MQLSPGEQSKGTPLKGRTVAITLAICLVLIALLLPQRANIREYRLYFMQQRKSVTFEFSQLTEDWTEQTLRERFVGLPLDCFDNDGRYLDERVCTLDVKSHNAVPAMFISFFFASGRLSRASVNIPWWAHGRAYGSLVAAFGKPSSSQRAFHDGVRLHGWQLSEGAALFLNRDRPFNPLAWNAIFWNSASSCKKNGCFTPK
jgi:hypothetical protein